MTYHSLYCVCRDLKEAEIIAETLVKEKLVACVNLLGPIQSIYTWNGVLQKEQEVAFFAKTNDLKLKAAIDRARSLHSYEVPCIVAHELSSGNEEYLRWITDQLNKP